MKSIVRWATRNSPAMNTLMIAVMAIGAVSLANMRREVFPEFGLEIILVTVPYPGASPAEVEEGICQRLEEAVRSIDGVKKQTAIAQEGAGSLVIELESGIDIQKTLGDVRSEIDRIPSFPVLSEDPEVKQITLRQVAIRVGVVGPDQQSVDAELALREVAERVRRDLLLLPAVSQATMLGARDYQIDIEISESTLRKHRLSLQRVAEIIRRENIEIPGGSLRTDAEEVLLRGKNKRLNGEEIGRIPLVTQPNGVVLTVNDLGNVKDEFTDSPSITLIDGRPSLTISIDRTSKEDLLEIAEQVHAFVDTTKLPPNYELRTWQDSSVDVRERMELLRRNGLQGLILVFLVLAAFLDLRLAFWVALGIPIAVLGAAGVLWFTDQTLNMISLFAFLLALGIVVDDAIVIGENIFAHRQQGKDYVTAAVDGTYEVLPSVAASVSTTIIAFVPLLYVSGTMGKFIAVLPVAVIAMLIISLVESATILPCHLAHEHSLFLRCASWILFPLRPFAKLMHHCNEFVETGLRWIVLNFYQPTLRRVLHNPGIALSSACATLLVTLAFVPAGITPWNIFPKLDSKWVEARVTFPDGTPTKITDEATRKLASELKSINDKHAGGRKPLVKLVQRSVGDVVSPSTMGPAQRTSGSHVGLVFVELCDNSERTIKSDQILDEWRRAVGEIAGSDRLTFGTPEMGPGGAAIEFKILAPVEHMKQLEAAVELAKQELANLSKYPGVVDIVDDSSPGKWEYQIRVKESAMALSVTAADLAETVRSTYYGAEVMRLQRGRHEVKLMVRYPAADRHTLASLDEIRVRSQNGIERPLMELAEVNVARGYSEINRVDQLRSITVTADVDEKQGNAHEIVALFKSGFEPALAEEFPEIRIRWEGQQEQTEDSIDSLLFGFVVALMAMCALLTLEFRSYFQPMIILSVIPFGLIGAIWGHALLHLSLTMFSLFGLVALTGVIVNDSIVLIDFINKQVALGRSIVEAINDAGSRRFRPVVLTSLTTVAGLTPMLLEKSFQAQVLIPMAASLCFGLVLGTVLVLYMAPTLFAIYARLILGVALDESVPREQSPAEQDSEPEYVAEI
jgi:multidrug efflux pump subunit AcrB